MTVWWCAIDVRHRHASYAELKERGVVAQGWPQLGDLRGLLKFVPDHWPAFDRTVREIGDVAGAHPEVWPKDRESRRAPKVLWNLLAMQAGDLVVGLEGTTVRGVCELPADGVDLYRYQPGREYAQTLSSVTWTDWTPSVFGPPPVAPAQGVHGIKTLRQGSRAVIDAWQRSRT